MEQITSVGLIQFNCLKSPIVGTGGLSDTHSSDGGLVRSALLFPQLHLQASTKSHH